MGPDLEDLTPANGSGRCRSVREVATTLGRGDGHRLVDGDFDQFLPHDLRLASGQHWTPLVVIARVAEWLENLGVRTVVDIGAGAGKFCVAAALASRCKFTGIEQRPRLVEVARGLARVFDVEERVNFVEGTLQGAIPEADAYYLFNPFGENLFGPEAHLAADVELSEARYQRDVALTEDFLDRARPNTYVIKYNGFGGIMPASYQPVRLDRTMPNVLRMWKKTGPSKSA